MMKRHYETELEAFRSHLILMGEKAIEQVSHAVEALGAADPAAARKVIAADDDLDRLEMLVDDEAVRYMSLRAPIATDLRLMVVGMKVSHELERVGDEAQSIAKRTLRILIPTPGGTSVPPVEGGNGVPPVLPPPASTPQSDAATDAKVGQPFLSVPSAATARAAGGQAGMPVLPSAATTATPSPPPAAVLDTLLRMTTLSQTMLRDALDCLFEPASNKDKALAVLRRDDEVDALNRVLYRELSSHMNAAPGAIPRDLELIFISKSLERIADHATNIAEEMVYLSEAHDIRHHTLGITPAREP